MAKSKENILAKIKKLQNMQESAAAIGNDNEAAAFASKVQQLLMQHKLDESELAGFSFEDKIEIDKDDFKWDDAGISHSKRKSHWLSMLGFYVAKYNGCEMHCYRSSNKISIIGTPESRNVVEYILTVLARYGSDNAEREYVKAFHEAKRAGHVETVRGFKRAFLSAYVSTIGQRLKLAHEQQLEAVSERGIMVLDAEKLAVDQFMKSLNLGKGTGFAGSKNAQGSLAGARAGKAVNITNNAIGSNGKRVRRIS